MSIKTKADHKICNINIKSFTESKLKENYQKASKYTKEDVTYKNKEFKLEPIWKATEKQKKVKYIIRNDISKFPMSLKFKSHQFAFFNDQNRPLKGKLSKYWVATRF